MNVEKILLYMLSKKVLVCLEIFTGRLQKSGHNFFFFLGSSKLGGNY